MIFVLLVAEFAARYFETWIRVIFCIRSHKYIWQVLNCTLTLSGECEQYRGWYRKTFRWLIRTRSSPCYYCSFPYKSSESSPTAVKMHSIIQVCQICQRYTHLVLYRDLAVGKQELSLVWISTDVQIFQGLALIWDDYMLVLRITSLMVN